MGHIPRLGVTVFVMLALLLQKSSCFISAVLVCLALLLSMTVTNFFLKGKKLITLALSALYFVPCSQVFLCPNSGSGLLSDGLTRELELAQNTLSLQVEAGSLAAS
jgi:hypothetical protein